MHLEYVPTHLEEWISNEYMKRNVLYPEDLTIPNLSKRFNFLVRTHPRDSASGEWAGIHLIHLDNRIDHLKQKENFYHELCHVHDQYNNLQMEKFNEGYYKDTGDLLFDLLKKHSSCVWDEYIAPRLSCSTLPKDSDLSYLFLLDLIKDTENKVKKDIEDYRTQGDISLLFKNIQELTSLTLKIAATVIGNLHGLNYNDTEVSEVINKGLEGTFIFPIWNELHETLENLYQSYPNWKDIYVFDSLNNLILKSWNELGVFPENRGQGLYVNVP
ncbi:hypothetical protein [Priestia megaterium]|uniref:hypothetical protein n=1 Tax=Priestia megaterium TaxID=1404 RepID=UPI00300BD4C8